MREDFFFLFSSNWQKSDFTSPAYLAAAAAAAAATDLQAGAECFVYYSQLRPSKLSRAVNPS